MLFLDASNRSTGPASVPVKRRQIFGEQWLGHAKLPGLCKPGPTPGSDHLGLGSAANIELSTIFLDDVVGQCLRAGDAAVVEATMRAAPAWAL
jgi:hypothetical protein